MAREGSVKYLNTAKSGKNDEFYTILSDIEKELRHYTGHFRNETVLCNCDDPRISNFFKYFLNNFEKLGLKELDVMRNKVLLSSQAILAMMNAQIVQPRCRFHENIRTIREDIS